MNGPRSIAAEKAVGDRLHDHPLRALYDEAYIQIEPLLSGTHKHSFSTTMYLAMNRLHASYPQLSDQELEALFLGLVKHRENQLARH